MDETYIKVKGQWKYLYRAVDTAGQIVNFLLNARRDVAVLRFFRKAIRYHGDPRGLKVTLAIADAVSMACIGLVQMKCKGHYQHSAGAH